MCLNGLDFQWRSFMRDSILCSNYLYSHFVNSPYCKMSDLDIDLRRAQAFQLHVQVGIL